MCVLVQGWLLVCEEGRENVISEYVLVTTFGLGGCVCLCVRFGIPFFVGCLPSVPPVEVLKNGISWGHRRGEKLACNILLLSFQQ